MVSFWRLMVKACCASKSLISAKLCWTELWVLSEVEDRDVLVGETVEEAATGIAAADEEALADWALICVSVDCEAATWLASARSVGTAFDADGCEISSKLEAESSAASSSRYLPVMSIIDAVCSLIEGVFLLIESWLGVIGVMGSSIGLDFSGDSVWRSDAGFT